MRNKTLFTEKELALFTSQNSIFNEAQMKIINRKTPESEIETKTDQNGNVFKSVKASYMKTLLMMVTGGNYNFEIKEQVFLSSAKEVKTLGKLTIFSNRIGFIREQDGKAESNIPEANAYKSSASDCLKKCMAEFGFCWDIYGQEHADQKKTEQPEPDHAEKKKLERLDHFLKEAKTINSVEHVYNKYLETAEETTASKDLLKKYLEPFVKAID